MAQTNLQRINQCKEIINETKLELMNKKIKCESSILNYLNIKYEIEENKLNQYLRDLTKIYDDDQDQMNDFENMIKIYRKDLDDNNLLFFNIVSLEWLQSSINLENKLNKLEKENQKLKLQIKSQIKSPIDNKEINELKLELKNVLKVNEENKYLKHNILKIYGDSINKFKEIKSLFQTSKPIIFNIEPFEIITNDNKINDINDINDISDINDINDIQKVFNDLNKILTNIIKYNKDFIISENKLCEEMKKETAKLVSKMEIKSIENEKLRDEEIRKLIKETRLNLDKQCQEYNTFCNKYRENVLKEAKQQIKAKQKNFETAKNLMKKKYEQEIISIKKLYDDKMIKLMDEKEKDYFNKLKSEKEQFGLQQELLQNEITNLSNNFKKEIQILKRFKPHHIVHVPINKNNEIEKERSYSAKLIQYLEQE